MSSTKAVYALQTRRRQAYDLLLQLTRMNAIDWSALPDSKAKVMEWLSIRRGPGGRGTPKEGSPSPRLGLQVARSAARIGGPVLGVQLEISQERVREFVHRYFGATATGSENRLIDTAMAAGALRLAPDGPPGIMDQASILDFLAILKEDPGDPTALRRILTLPHALTAFTIIDKEIPHA